MDDQGMDKIERHCVTMTRGDGIRKRSLGMTWRLLIRYGLKHAETCMPREEFINENYDKLKRSTQYAKLFHKLQTKYPKVFDEIINEIKAEH